MRALLPDPADDVDVHAHYAAGWTDRGGLRVNFVAAADGAAHAAGTSRGLQTEGDHVVFAALRDLADVVLVGSGTASAEGYRPSRPDARTRARRRDLGYAEVLPIAVSSRSLHVDPSAPLYADAEARTVVLTCGAATGERRRLAEVADVVDCGDEALDPRLMRQALEQRGHRRILSEGGPTVFADLAAGGVVDELCLSLSPLLVGPGPGRISAGDGWDAPVDLALTGLLEDAGALFLRYATTAR